jgi:hypothetical protein
MLRPVMPFTPTQAAALRRDAADNGPSHILLRAGDVTVGRFRCAATAGNFRTAGAMTRHCFVFPRRAVWIQHEGQAPFVADPTRITLYNPQQIYERRALDPAGDHSDWIELPDAVVREVARYDPAAAESPARVLRHTMRLHDPSCTWRSAAFMSTSNGIPPRTSSSSRRPR